MEEYQNGKDKMAIKIPCLKRSSSFHFHAMNVGPPIRRKVITVWIPVFVVCFGLYQLLISTSTEWQGPVEVHSSQRMVTESFLDIEETLNSTQSQQPSNNTTQETLIPRKIHQGWISNEVGHMSSIWIKTFLSHHPDWEYWFWTPAEATAFLKQFYPDMLPIYEGFRESAQSEDLLRYLVLHHYGGFFVDLDIKCLKPLDPWATMYSCFVSKEPYEHLLQYDNSTIHTVANGLIVCRAGHPFLMEAAKKVQTLFRAGKLPPLNTTGSSLLTQVMKSYQANNPSPPPKDEVKLIPPKYFMSTYDEGNVHIVQVLKAKCEEPILEIKLHTNEKAICKAHRKRMGDNSPTNDSYTNHFWLPLHSDNSKRLYTVSIFGVNPKTKTYRNSAAGS